jgi:hypothetical protein
MSHEIESLAELIAEGQLFDAGCLTQARQRWSAAVSCPGCASPRRPGVRIKFGFGERLVAGLLDPVFHPQPVEQCSLGLLPAGDEFDQVPDEMGVSQARPVISPACPPRAEAQSRETENRPFSSREGDGLLQCGRLHFMLSNRSGRSRTRRMRNESVGLLPILGVWSGIASSLEDP